ncbi:transglutaminase-like domain-containing protein [Tenuifilum sp.]|uniref:transglutaminase-like domain-containing protein n=1 Tax=Tenuifilum sp. TaxID=2760880 RepID=UPI00403E9839
MDFTNPTTRSFALSLASEYEGEFNIDQICNIYSYLYDNWKYVSDPRGIDYFAKASETIESNLCGDCDDFAILMAATLECIGGKTRINFVVNENGNAHAFTEVYLKANPDEIKEKIDYHYQNIFQILFGISSVKQINYTLDKNGIWLNLDWNSKYPGGPYDSYIERTIYYPRKGLYEKFK